MRLSVASARSIKNTRIKVGYDYLFEVKTKLCRIKCKELLLKACDMLDEECVSTMGALFTGMPWVNQKYGLRGKKDGQYALNIIF